MWPVTFHWEKLPKKYEKQPKLSQATQKHFYPPSQIKSTPINQKTTQFGNSACVDTRLQTDTILKFIVLYLLDFECLSQFEMQSCITFQTS